MDVRDHLRKLEEPDPAALDRVWQRFVRTRAEPRRKSSGWLLAPVGLAIAAAAVVWMRTPAPDRTVVLDAETEAAQHAWSEQIQLDYAGVGEIEGSDRDARIHWRSGTLTASVVPNSGTALTVVTDEARVQVVGTVFSVTRDRLGVTTSVERGKVAVTCTDGYEGHVTPESGPHTCLPTRPGLLLGRADALIDAGADAATRMRTLDLGLELAERDSATASELLVRRMQTRGELGDLEGVLTDAETYLAGPGSRRTEVLRYASYQALGERRCDRALPHLSELELIGTAQDRVLLAECLLADQPARARQLLEDAIPNLDTTWQQRAQRSLASLR